MEELFEGMFVWSCTLGEPVLVLSVPDDEDLDPVLVETEDGTEYAVGIDDLMPIAE